MWTCPIISKYEGKPGEAPKVSMAFTENPSTVDLGNAGKVSGEMISVDVIRSRDSSSEIYSDSRGNEISKRFRSVWRPC